MANDDAVGNQIERDGRGYYINVFDHRPGTLNLMANFEFEGGGRTWMNLIRAAMKIESVAGIDEVCFDDESDVVLVSSSSEHTITVVHALVTRLMSEHAFLESCLAYLNDGGEL